MTAIPVRGPERPRHIDARITNIGVEDLALATGMSREKRKPTVADVRARLTLRHPVWDLSDWADGSRGTPAATETIEAADTLVREGIDVTGAGHGRSRLYGFHYLRWLDPLARAYLLTGDTVYVHTFSRLIRAWEASRDDLVGLWPGLDVVWYSLGCWCRSNVLLPALHAFADALDDEAWVTTVTTLLGGARWIHDEHTAFRHGNWQLVAATQLLHLGHVMPDFVEAQNWVARSLDRIQEHLALDFYPDGGHYERSPGYHLMCLRNLQIAAVVDRVYGDGALVAEPRFRQAHTWIAAMTSPAGWAPAFQDSQVEWPGDVLVRGAWILEDPSVLRAARELMPPHDFDRETQLLPQLGQAWVRSNLGTGSASGGSGSTVLPDSGYSVLHTRSGGDLRVTINHGPHIEHELESHSHDAVLDFVADFDGRPLLWEAGGPPNYDDPDYRSWFQAPIGHNAVHIEGVGLDRERHLHGRVLEGAAFSVFLGRQHGFGIPQYRTIVLVRGEQPLLLVRDRAEPSARHEGASYSLRWHAAAPWSRTDEGSWCTDALTASTRRADAGRVESLGPARVPSGDYGQAPYEDLGTLTFTNRTGSFDTLLVPHRTTGPSSAHGPKASPRTQTRAPVLVAADDGPAGSDDAVVETAEGTVRLGASSVVFRSHPPASKSRILGWRVQSLGDGAIPLLTSSVPVDASGEWDEDVFDFSITTEVRCSITFHVPVHSIRLDGIKLEEPGSIITVPYGGTWTVSGRHG